MCEDEIVVLVDYQTTYRCALDPVTTEAVYDELEAAMQKGAYIILVHFHGFGDIDERIFRFLGGYDKVITCPKYNADGSFEVMRACVDAGLIPDYKAHPKFRIFGVETDVCVYHTAKNLGAKYGAKVSVVKAACNRSVVHPKRGQPWWLFDNLKNVELVG